MSFSPENYLSTKIFKPRELIVLRRLAPGVNIELVYAFIKMTHQSILEQGFDDYMLEFDLRATRNKGIQLDMREESFRCIVKLRESVFDTVDRFSESVADWYAEMKIMPIIIPVNNEVFENLLTGDIRRPTLKIFVNLRNKARSNEE